MTDSALDKAKSERFQLLARKKELTAEIKSLDDRLNHIEVFLALYDEFAGTKDENPQDNAVVSADSGAGTEPTQPTEAHLSPTLDAGKVPFRSGASSPWPSVVQAVERMIRETGRPMGRTELLERLKAEGFLILGKNRHATLYTMLWRGQDRLHRLEGGRYWLRNQPIPTAEHATLRANGLKDAAE